MLDGVRIGFVGSGAMAEAIIKGLLDRRLVTAEHISAAGPRPERGEELRERYGVAVTTDNTASVAGASIVVLAVKPQMLGRVMPAVKGGIAGDALVLSIVAGARIAVIEHGL